MTDAHGTHEYRVSCAWTGSTALGYEAYDRTHTATAPSVAVELALSSDPAFRGDPKLWNPELLLVAAAASCQMLSFLAVATRARLDVVEYRDEAEGVMPGDDRPMRITRVVLRPQIVLRGELDVARVRHLCDVAHEECFITNSLTTDVVVEPTIDTTA
jgi:organic hydroperoxide reductase OsmC/OhrA